MGCITAETSREGVMRQFTMTVTALAAFGALVATAQAEVLGGGPMKNGNQCFTYSKGNAREGRFGSWGACPQTASTNASSAATAAATPRTRRNGAASR